MSVDTERELDWLAEQMAKDGFDGPDGNTAAILGLLESIAGLWRRTAAAARATGHSGEHYEQAARILEKARRDAVVVLRGTMQ